MKLFKATIVSGNSCYIETVLIVAENEKLAHELLTEKKKRKIEYKSSGLKELNVDFTKPNVVEMVGFGENESNYEGDD